MLLLLANSHAFPLRTHYFNRLLTTSGLPNLAPTHRRLWPPRCLPCLGSARCSDFANHLPQRFRVRIVQRRQLHVPRVAKLKRLLQPPLCPVQIAQLALVTGEVVSHRRADGEFVHDAQQVVAGLRGPTESGRRQCPARSPISWRRRKSPSAPSGHRDAP